MYTSVIIKDKKIKHLLTHVPDPAKDTLVSKFKKLKESNSSNLKDYTSSVQLRVRWNQAVYFC